LTGTASSVMGWLMTGITLLKNEELYKIEQSIPSDRSTLESFF
jgi:hypothetical protein